MRKTLTALCMAAAIATGAQAGVFDYRVTWDTTNLQAGYFDPAHSGYYLFEAQLTNGDGVNGNNFASLSNFDLGGGQDQTTIFTDGDATGDLTHGIDLHDTQFSNLLVAQFQPGSRFDFDLRISSDFEPFGFPDQFSISLYYFFDGDYQIQTEDPLLSQSFLRADLGGAPPLYRGDENVFNTFNSFASVLDDSKYLPAPQLQLISAQATPEPAAAVLMGPVLIALGAFRLRRRRLQQKGGLKRA